MSDTQEIVEEVSALGMSDEDWLAQGDALLQEPTIDEEIEDTSLETTEESEDDSDVSEQDSPTEEDEEDSDDEDSEADSSEAKESDDEDEEVTDTEDEDTSEDKDVESDQEEDKPDYESLYKKLTAPFKANGKEVQVESPEDAIKLMQMGANYYQEMRNLKPSKRILKLLENSNLLDEQKLSHLIDVNNGDPKAIAKLLADSKVDPMEIDTKDGEDYQAPNRVSDSELALDEVLNEIRGSDHFTQTLDLVAKQWDAKSKSVIQEQPEVLRAINDHMASGVYDLIDKELQRERMRGRLIGLSDIDAYRTVGDSIQARGGFDHLFQSQETISKRVVEKEVTPKSKKSADPKLTQKRKAASPTKQKSSQTKAQIPDVLNMSDEEFEKQFSVNLR